MGSLFFVGVVVVLIVAVWVLFSWRPAWALAAAAVFSATVFYLWADMLGCGLGAMRENATTSTPGCTANDHLVHSLLVWHLAAIAAIPAGVLLGVLLKKRLITLVSPAVAALLLAYTIVLSQSLQ